MQNVHPSLVAQVEEDLSFWPFITREMINNALSTGFHLHLKIIDNTLHILGNKYSYETRNDSVIKVLRDVTAFRRVPNCELVIDCQDGRYVDLMGNYPAFAMAKPLGAKHILYPDFTFGGWPEVSVLPWADSITVATQKTKSISWDKKIETLFFRGANTHPIRFQMQSMSKDNPDILDCYLMDWQKSESMSLIGSSTHVPIYDHGNYKYLINLPGNTYSSRLKYLFLFNSFVIQIDNGWIEFWYKLLQNEINCVILGPDQVSLLPELIKFLKDNDSEAEMIAKEGTKTILNNFSYENILDYWQLLLTLYSKRLNYDVIAGNH